MLKVARDMEPKSLSESAPSEVLGREECLRLLASETLGRLAISLRSEVPMIRPVNYVFDERSQSIVFRTDFGSKFQGILVSAKAAFEVDSVDRVRRTGWSVIVTGSVEKVSNHLELERFETLELRPWEPGEKRHWVRIRVWTITGRRIASGDSVGHR
jgi:nitroimidazol reductase NimA-like FMN-containing flavoprotein (pyridoxamine 5'-phosphate oxidase superfamily)